MIFPLASGTWASLSTFDYLEEVSQTHTEISKKIRKAYGSITVQKKIKIIDISHHTVTV